LRAIVGDDPVNVIRAASERAIRFLDDTIGELSRTQERIRQGEPAAWPTISDTVARSLRERFGLNPEDHEVWTTAGNLTSGGSGTITLLLTRLRRVREILVSGWIRFTCISADCGLDDWAFAYVGKYRVYLCRLFWENGASVDDQALTILHEAFHIYFGATDSGRTLWNAHCIEQFVADFNEVTIQADFSASCT
jgi:hypothetical protein